VSSAVDEISRLQAQLKELLSAWAEFEHQARRYGDAKERAGGILHDVDMDVRQVFRNLKDNEAEQARVRARLDELSAQSQKDNTA